MLNFDFKLNGNFKRQAKGRFNRYTFEVGILQNRPHRRPLPASRGHGTLAGGPVRRKSLRIGGSVADVSENVRRRVNIYRLPFTHPRSRAMLAFKKAAMELMSGAAKSYSKVETTLRAVVRLPMQRGDYGNNTRATARRKGFNRFLFDTGQLYRAIAARVRSRNVQK